MRSVLANEMGEDL